jgi:homoserine O-acetyltransferase
MHTAKTYRYNKSFLLESGEQLPGLELSYHTWGRLNESKDNVIWICHALTGSADVEQWWPGLIGPGKLFDTNHYFVICANVLGGCYGSTGPLSINPQSFKPYYHSFPFISVGDVICAFELLRKQLGIRSLALLIGGSLGGQQAVQWAVDQPQIVKRLVLLATNARHSPWGIAFNETQRMAIAGDASWKLKDVEAGKEGLKAARAIALLSYRTYQVYDDKQQDQIPRPLDAFCASSYQQYQGDKFIARFNAFTYWTLSKMMDAHDVGRAYESTEQALQRVAAKTLVIGIDSDILFPPVEQQFLAQHIPDARLHLLSSIYGHDGFLVETEAVSAAVQDLLDLSQKNTEAKAVSAGAASQNK